MKDKIIKNKTASIFRRPILNQTTKKAIYVKCPTPPTYLGSEEERFNQDMIDKLSLEFNLSFSLPSQAPEGKASLKLKSGFKLS